MCRGVRRERQKERVKTEIDTERDGERYKQRQSQRVYALGESSSGGLGIIL